MSWHKPLIELCDNCWNELLDFFEAEADFLAAANQGKT
jgi:hypothetical protein